MPTPAFPCHADGNAKNSEAKNPGAARRKTQEIDFASSDCFNLLVSWIPNSFRFVHALGMSDSPRHGHRCRNHRAAACPNISRQWRMSLVTVEVLRSKTT